MNKLVKKYFESHVVDVRDRLFFFHKKFLGSWQWSSNSESFDDYLKEIGINIVLRKLSRLANPTVTFLKVNDTWTMRTDTVVKSISVDFNLMKEFKEQTVDGRTLNSTFSIEQVVTQDSKTKVD
ncbi:unnamed protein product [Lepeophtheirus salmonis]|uniref:(salmon louse) hypothetical protein n=1 Tax=Lepeophtheirus salmonis TaxID=72036 RepID=A0A7R8D6H4_LEPSM|nr:unnamed protein product [Lepeophtheirus salmonis]CAF3040952.1 unnamed protein product [Lepeophtheirus salmonis]